MRNGVVWSHPWTRDYWKPPKERTMWKPGDPRRLGDWCPEKGCYLLLTGLRSDKKTYYCLNGHEHVNAEDADQPPSEVPHD